MLFLDLETYSETPISRGTFRYAADAQIMLLAWAVDAGPVSVWDLTSDPNMPLELAEVIRSGQPVVAHNAQFDMNVCWLAANSPAELRDLGEDIGRWRCTMAQSLSHSLPAKLSALCEVLHLPASMAKDDGHSLLMLFCKPMPANSRLRRATSTSHPEEWTRFVKYAGQDIVAMRGCMDRMPVWNWQPRDIALWHLDQEINRRGFAVDLDLARSAVDLCGERARENAGRTLELTDGEVERVTQRDRLLKHLLMNYGVDLPDMRASTLERRIDDDTLPWAVRELLGLRLSGAKNSVSKYRTLTRSVSDDGRLRGTIQFRGASRTGRDAGRVFQPQNLPRPKADADEIETWIGLCKARATDVVGFDDVQMASDAIRGSIVAGPGRKLVQADFSNIEGRLAAWLADETWKLDAFRAYDAGTGPDLYRVTAGRAFNKPVEDVTGDDRQIGKVVELACLGPDTEVLTDRGFVPIVSVRRTDKLWDGVEWVTHEGVIYRGEKEVLEWQGILITPDHLLLAGEAWVAADQVITEKSTHSRVLATGKGALWSLATGGFPGREDYLGSASGSAAIAGRTNTSSVWSGGSAAGRTSPTPGPSLPSQPPPTETRRSKVYDIMCAGSRNRFLIRVSGGYAITHNCGYQGAVGAFNAMGAVYGVHLAEDKALSMVQAWRRAHPATVALWRRLENAAITAIRTPDTIVTVGRVKFCFRKPWLKLQLPSGRILSYPHAGIDLSGKIKYRGQSPYTRKWSEVWTYGGKLLENICQAVASDLLWSAIPRAEEAGYRVILRVHDELLTEPLDDPEHTVDGLIREMVRSPRWAEGLPVAAAGFESRRYRKV